MLICYCIRTIKSITFLENISQDKWNKIKFKNQKIRKFQEK